MHFQMTMSWFVGLGMIELEKNLHDRVRVRSNRDSSRLDQKNRYGASIDSIDQHLLP